MMFDERIPPRAFFASSEGACVTWDCGSVILLPNEQVTFSDSAGGPEHTDVTRKEWGYYLTRSCNDHQTRNKWRTAVIRNVVGRTYVVMVAMAKVASFDRFLRETKHSVVMWVDDAI